MYVEDVIFYFTCGPWNKQVSLPQVSICSVEDIYFPSWKISEPCHWEKGHAKNQLCEAACALLWLQRQPLGTASAGCAPTGPCTARHVWAVTLKTRSTPGNLHRVGLVPVVISTQRVKCSGTWPTEKPLQKQTLPWLDGGNAEHCIKVASRGLQRLLWRNGWGDLKAMPSSSDHGWSTSPWKTKSFATADPFPHVGSLLKVNLHYVSWQGKEGKIIGSHWMAEQIQGLSAVKAKLIFATTRMRHWDCSKGFCDMETRGCCWCIEFMWVQEQTGGVAAFIEKLYLAWEVTNSEAIKG